MIPSASERMKALSNNDQKEHGSSLNRNGTVESWRSNQRSNNDNNSNKPWNKHYDSNYKTIEYGVQSLKINSPSYATQPKKTTTWASIASQPAKLTPTSNSLGMKKKGPGMPPGPIIPGKHNIDISSWESKTPPPPQQLPPVVRAPVWPQQPPPQQQIVPQQSIVQHIAPASSVAVSGLHHQHIRPSEYNNGGGQHQIGHDMQHQVPAQMNSNNFVQMVSAQPMMPFMPTHIPPPGPMPSLISNQGQVVNTPPFQTIMLPPPNLMPQVTTSPQPVPTPHNPVLEHLQHKNNYNPPEFDLTAPNARFFVIKSYSEDDIHRSIKYEIWCSTEHGNRRLDQAYREREKEDGMIYLFFSVNGSGHFCGMAQMVSPVDYHSNSSVWAQDKWKGQFRVRWLYVKDVPNNHLRHIQLENNENKAVTHSRDTQEVPHAKGLLVLQILHNYKHTTSIFDDFSHYEKRQMQEDVQRKPEPLRDTNSPTKDHAYVRRKNNNFSNRPNNYNKIDNNKRDDERDRNGYYQRDNNNGGGYYSRGGGITRNNNDSRGSSYRDNNYYSKTRVDDKSRGRAKGSWWVQQQQTQENEDEQ